jgi:hypothetical protein
MGVLLFIHIDMKLRSVRYIVTLLTIFLFNLHVQSQEAPSRFKFWFNKPAETWNDALPVGNGSLGAMIFGGIDQERLEIMRNLYGQENLAGMQTLMH